VYEHVCIDFYIVRVFLQPTKTFFGAGTPAEGEEDFIATVMMNDAFWERTLAGQN